MTPSGPSSRRCEGCASRLKAALEAAPGVQSASVDFATGGVGVRVSAGSESDSQEALRHAILAVDLTYIASELTLPDLTYDGGSGVMLPQQGTSGNW